MYQIMFYINPQKNMIDPNNNKNMRDDPRREMVDENKALESAWGGRALGS